MVNYQDITNLINESDDDFESFDEFERILKAALKAKNKIVKTSMMIFLSKNLNNLF